MTEPRIEVTIAAPVETVWNALRDKEKIRHWHGWDYEGLADEIDLIYFTSAGEDAETRTLNVQDDGGVIGDVITVRPDGDGARVTLTRAPRGVSAQWDAYYDDITEGWTTFLHQLKFAVERQPADRRTIFLSGHTRHTGPVAAQLGLPADGPYAASIVGEEVKGEVWFRSDNQLGVTVDAWGHDGLLVVAYIAPTEAKPKGSAMAVLSTYGLDDDRFAALEARWTAWWSERYPTDDTPA